MASVVYDCIMFRAFLIGIVALALTATDASAKVTGDWGRYEHVANSLAVPLPNAYIHRGGCPSSQHQGTRPACANPSTGEIWIPDEDSARFTLAHELGHVFDGQYLTDSDREWLRRVMTAPSGDWWKPNGAGEWFADFYGDCAVGLGRTSLEGYAERPSPRRLRRVCTAIHVWALIRH